MILDIPGPLTDAQQARREQAQRWGQAFAHVYGLEETWEGDGPHDFRQGAARFVRSDVYFNDESIRAGGPVEFKCLFSSHTEAFSVLSALIGDLIPAWIEAPSESSKLWRLRWSVQLPETPRSIIGA